MALPDGVKLDPLPERGEFDVRRARVDLRIARASS